MIPTIEMECSDAAPNLSSVPTEILLYILSILPSRALLPVLPVSRRFYSAAIRILHTRLTKAATLPDHRLILECYHPSAKISTPYLYCDYISTDSLTVDQEGAQEGGNGPQRELSAGLGLPRPTLGDLGRIYAHFRPVVQEENRRPRSRYPRRTQATQPISTNIGIEGGGDGGGPSSQAPQGQGPEQEQEWAIPTQDIYLDENQLFSQLCTITNLVRLGPKPGLFISHVNVSDGIIRVWREWLSRQTANGNGNSTDAPELLWADISQNVGLHFRVAEKGVSQADYNYRVPVLMAADEEPPVAYRLELEELVVRANHLLLAMEKSEMQEFATSGKAIMISAAAAAAV